MPLPVPRLRFRLRAARRPRLRLVLLLAAAPLVYEAARVVLGPNRHEVIPGRVYRSAQPTGDDLRELIAEKGIRTVTCLRGFCPGPQAPWYEDEVRATNAAGVSQEDVTLSANRLPPPDELRRLIEVLDGTEYPILFHCKQGADRTGLVAAVVLLLDSDATLDRARWQLLPRYGHFRFGRTAAIDDFFDRYEAWLAGRGEAHTPARFRDYAANHYSPGPAAGTLTLDAPPGPVPADRWLALKVTAANTSAEAWEMKPGNYAGVHVDFTVQTEAGDLVYRGQAGLFRRAVPPGGSVGLTLAVPPLKTPGRYSLRADLMDATGAAVPVRQTGFYQFGADPLLVTIEVK